MSAENVELEGLEFEIKDNAETAAKNIDKLSDSLTRLKQIAEKFRSADGVGKTLDKLGASAEKFSTAKTKALSGFFRNLSAMNNVKISATIPNRMNEIADAAEKFNDNAIARLERFGNAMQNIGAAGSFPTQHERGASVSGNSTQEEPRDSGTERADSSIDKTRDKIEIASKSTGKWRKALSLLFYRFADGRASHFLNVLSLIGKNIKSIDKSSSGASGKLGQFFNSIKRIAMYRAIRSMLSAMTSGINEGIKNLYQYSKLTGGMFAKSMNSLATDAQYLKNSLGAMAAPLITAFAPAVDFVTEKVVRLFNVVNQLVSRLTGNNTYTVAKKISAQYADAANSAKQIKNTIGIDELNIIDDGSDSGGSAKGYGEMFEEKNIDNDIGSFADRLKEAFTKGDWEGLGRLAGDKVNRIFEAIGWSSAGEKLGEGINGAIKTAYFFLDETSFDNLGAGIASFLNSALEKTEFTFVGKLIAKPFTSVGTFIISGLKKVKWRNVSSSISEIIKGAFSEATTWLDGIEWEDLGEQLWRDIKDFLEGFDWDGVAENAFTFLGTAIRSAGKFIWGFFGSIAEDIKKWWQKDINGASWEESATNLINAIGRAIGRLGIQIGDYIVKPLIKAIVGDEAWGNGGENVYEQFKLGWLIVAADEVNHLKAWVDIANTVSEWVENIKNWWEEAKIKALLFPLKIDNTVSKWAENIKNWWEEAKVDALIFPIKILNKVAEWIENIHKWW